MMYKNGISVPIDYGKAYQCFSKGAALGHPMSIYGKGYMLYKGYGCTQNYDQAANLFKQAAKLRDESSWYMLGLSYRNGYGVPINLDSAKYWLQKATSRGDKRAKNELADTSPENADIKDIPKLQPAASGQFQPADLKTGYKKLQQHLIRNDFDGEYNGYVIRFDWSGKHVIAQNPLKLRLEEKKKTVTGEWVEGGSTIPISGTINDTALVFNNTAGTISDHYHKASPLQLEFKDSKLSMTKSGDTVYLSGNLSLYSPKLREPQRPEFIMLIRTGSKSENPLDTNINSLASNKADSVHFVAYPNPFTGPLNLSFTLKKAARVSVLITSLLNGITIYRSAPVELLEGDHNSPVNFNGQPGNYVVTLQYGSKVKSAIVFKH